MKTLFKTIIGLTFLLLISCETDIPETDNTSPTFTFKLTGDGFEQTFNQETDFDSFQLNLRINTDYTFIYSGGDDGGMKQIQLDIVDSSNTINYTSSLEEPWHLTEDGFHNIINWNGNRDNSVTGSILYGTFTTGDTPNGGMIPVSFKLYLADFGGQEGNSNTTFGDLNIEVGNFNTEIINF